MKPHSFNDGAHYLLGSDGRIAFTPEGRYVLGIRFGLAGIDLRAIQTENQYRAALERSRPYVTETLRRIAANGPMTDERHALVALAQGDYERADAILQRRPHP